MSIEVVSEAENGTAQSPPRPPAASPPTRGETPAAPTSPLSEVRARLNRARRKRHVDVPVPFTDGYVVRYGPIPDQRRQEILDNRRQEKGEVLVLASADVLASACLGIFDTVDGKLVSFDPDDGTTYVDAETDQIVGRPLTFSSPRTIEILGAEASDAVSVVRAFYATDGDIISASDRVMEVSGYFRAGLGNS